MTMPKTAAVVASLGAGVLPETMSNEQLSLAIQALEHDLPGDPIAYIRTVAPHSDMCECGALHLSVDATDLSECCASSLHRVLATPYGDIVREQFRRELGYQTIRFGWSGIEARVPTFAAATQDYGVRTVHGSELSSEAMYGLVDAFRQDMPGVMDMLEQSVALSEQAGGPLLQSHSVAPSAEDDGRRHWQELISQVMFAWSTPVRKYLDEYLLREYGMVGGAVNCCIISTMRAGESSWPQQWFDEQTGQQLTPDC